MSSAVEYLGFAAAACTTCSFIPQVRLVWRERQAQGVSLSMYLIMTFGVFLWLCYGLMIDAWPVVAANGATLVLASSVLIMKWRFERGGAAAPRA
ncbi:SemiSWEET transporter [Janthinobacterium fluminis]|uniref:SemiSWEET transporter n=1 Tax=Janthinobacterium fluminis TaxID=2987524 RepID=A0ABT5JYI5_9BURK|nr:SemiSWEET transporter [Janthinobacterium fluminis]MDC8757772.1 SemiSWEET transporter [Janthinobacterium fluminis]